MRYKETDVDSQTRTFGALLSASQTVWYIHKLRVHSQNRLSEASRYFVAHFAHVWLRHNIRKRNIPLPGMFLFYIVDSQTRTFGALLSASQTVWYIHKLRVHSQNRLSEASRYFVAHFAHVWLRHNIRKRNIPLPGMFLFYIVDSQTRTFGALLSASQTVCSLMAQEKQMAAYAAACFSFAPITS